MSFVDTDSERVRSQTVEEWLQEYSTGIKVQPARLHAPTAYDSVTKAKAIPDPYSCEAILKYHGHRTSKPNLKPDTPNHLKREEGGLVLSFVHIENGEEVIAFFNVKTKRTRGTNKGSHYQTGEGGQFNSAPRSKFRKFWMQTVGQEPRRWSRVHHELKPKLEGMLFTAELKTAYRSDGTPYKVAENLRQVEHSDCTMSAQQMHNESTKSVHKEPEQTLYGKRFQASRSTRQDKCTNNLVTKHTNTQLR